MAGRSDFSDAAPSAPRNRSGQFNRGSAARHFCSCARCGARACCARSGAGGIESFRPPAWSQWSPLLALPPVTLWRWRLSSNNAFGDAVLRYGQRRLPDKSFGQYPDTLIINAGFAHCLRRWSDRAVGANFVLMEASESKTERFSNSDYHGNACMGDAELRTPPKSSSVIHRNSVFQLALRAARLAAVSITHTDEHAPVIRFSRGQATCPCTFAVGVQHHAVDVPQAAPTIIKDEAARTPSTGKRTWRQRDGAPNT